MTQQNDPDCLADDPRQCIIATRGSPASCIFAPGPDTPNGLFLRGRSTTVDLYTYPALCDAATVDHTRDALQTFLWAHPTSAAILCEKALDELGWLIDRLPQRRD